MNDFTLLLSGLFASIGLICWLWWHRRTLVAVLALAALFPALYLMSAEFLGRPKPYTIEMRLAHTEVLWVTFDPGESIYLVLTGPRLYSVPWDYELAKKLNEAMKRAGKRGGRVLFGRDREHPGTFVAHAEPQPELPDKEDGSDTSQ